MPQNGNGNKMVCHKLVMANNGMPQNGMPQNGNMGKKRQNGN